MPRRHYQLDPGGPPRVEVRWGLDGEDLETIVDGDSLGKLGSRTQARKGSTFALAAGGDLFVQWDEKANGPRVDRNGVPLVEDDRPRIIGNAIAMIYLIGAVNLAAGCWGLYDGRTLVAVPGWSWIQLVFGALMLVLGRYASSRSRPAFAIAAILYSLLIITLIVEAFVRRGNLQFSILSFVFAWFILRGYLAQASGGIAPASKHPYR